MRPIQTGIKSSKLLSDLFEGKRHNVPVGQTPLTNTFEDNNINLYPQRIGQPMADIDLSLFVAEAHLESQRLVREGIDGIDTEFGPELNAKLTIDVQLDEKEGKLNIIKQDGSVVEIPGFLVQSDFGVGPRGSTGPRGRDGANGFDGPAGHDGQDGCVGQAGEEGEEGEEGAPGPDGDQGYRGSIGQEGPKGPEGRPGPVGRQGHEGARGRQGPSCKAGSQGPQGDTGQGAAPTVISSSNPTNSSALIWGKL